MVPGVGDVKNVAHIEAIPGYACWKSANLAFWHAFFRPFEDLPKAARSKWLVLEETGNLAPGQRSHLGEVNGECFLCGQQRQTDQLWGVRWCRKMERQAPGQADQLSLFLDKIIPGFSVRCKCKVYKNVEQGISCLVTLVVSDSFVTL